ncbi:ankyrin [Mytilinidion resinicola]|uniref:Ankyrin n=1 Tax=Mytilinidion resinicola TaxID=574789 RepID=A0A6A6YRG1_9PEZI|nr:ankyrin [Mytilinidion resinicola]KAF2811526.1 ankyrin [Mytilinidion resinicola]
MADPLSVAGSIAGLISVADTVFRLVFKYARSAINAKEEVKTLADEIQALAGVLQSLRLLASGLEAEGTSFDPTIRAHHLGSLSSTLGRLQQRVEKAHTKFEKDSKAKKILQQVKWPFSTGETKELLEDLIRHKTTISLALSVDSMQKLQLCLGKQEVLSQSLSSMANAVKRIEIYTQITMSDSKKAVLDFFMKASPQPNLETSVKLRQPMTGLWLTGSPSFTTWLETPGSKLWLSGIPGAGKTVLAGAVIQDALTRSYSQPEVGVAFFFCDYKDSTTWDIVKILGAIASQLSRQNDDAYSKLQAYYDQLHPARHLEKSLDTEDLRAKITEMSEHFKQILVVVDGLDECGDNTDLVVETLSELANYTPNMSMALLSRHEVNIEEWLREDFDHIPIAAKSDDIRLYVGAEMDKRIQNRQLRITSLELRDEIMNRLVERAKGMFRWVACQLDYLCDCVNDADRREALNELPPDLPETYRRLLERVDKCPAKVKSLVQMCLQFIAFASPPLTILQLQQAVSAPQTFGVTLDELDLISEYEIARRCSSLIRKSEDGNRFEYSHFSVQEFLTDATLLNSSALERYHLSEPHSYTLLATQCLRFLQLKNFGRHPEPSEEEAVYISQRNLENPFYEYAAILWPKFARNYFGDPVLFNLAISLFRRPKTVHFLAWSVEFLRHFHDGDKVWQFPRSPEDSAGSLDFYVRSVTEDFFSPLHLAAALHIPEICKSLIADQSDLNHNSAWGSPLQLATASLAAFWKTEDQKESSPHGNLWCEELNLRSDTARKNRLETIELLVGAGAVVTNSASQVGSNLLDLSFLLAGVFLDLSATNKLMSLGVVPGPTSLDSFGRCMSTWDQKMEWDIQYEKMKVVMSDTLRDFLNHIIITRIYGTELGRQIASIAWTAASQLLFSFEWNINPMVSDSTCTEDLLRAEAMSAVLCDDPQILQDCLKDEKLDIRGTFHPSLDRPYYGCSLLHVAAQERSESVSQILVESGCDLNAPDSDGVLPIHLCARYDNRSTLEVFLQKGASHLATDSNGKNLWHYCVDSQHNYTSILRRLLDLDQDQTTEALLARTHSGMTPILEALTDRYSEEAVARLLLVIDHCAGKPQFWKAHGPVFAAAAEFGSETVIEHLLQAGADPDPIRNDNFTPLHQLGSDATPECAQILNGIYPEAHQLRFQGQTPLERYIEGQFKLNRMPQQGVLAVLATQDAVSSQDTDGETVWSFCCKQVPIRSASWNKVDTLYNGFDYVISTLLRLGAMVSYEEMKRKPGTDPKEVLLALLSHSAEEEMKDCSPHGLGLGLLHMVVEAQHGRKTLTHWLVNELTARGIDINGEAMFKPGYTPLVHHLSRGAYGMAEVLLELGANPFVNSAFDPVRASLTESGTSFLKRLLRYSNETGTPVQWNGIFTCAVKFEGSSKDIEGVTSLHYIAGQGLNEIMDFYIDESLLGDINVMTVDGYTAVHLAAIHDRAAAIHRLHVQGANLAIESHDGSTALHLAVRAEGLSAVKVLLESGAKSSLDAVAMTPMMYASALKNEDMITLLDQYLPLGVETSSSVDINSISRKRMILLARSLEHAIMRDNLEECQRLYRAGCSLDTSMPSCHGCSPMMKAIRYERLHIVDWLLQCKATTLKSACDHPGGYSAIEIAISYTSLNPILYRLLIQYIEQGGGMPDGTHYPLECAIRSHNTEGLRIFLDFVKELAEGIRQVAPQTHLTSSSQSASPKLANVVNQRIYSLKGDIFYTPLHVAVQYGNIPAIELLLNRGATVDGCDSNYLTPLECVLTQSFVVGYARCDKETTSDAAVRLVQQGAATGIPSEEDFGEKSFLHGAMCYSGYSELSPGWNSALQKVTPFPWHHHWPDFHKMAFLTSSFELYRRRLPHDALKRIMNLQPERGISPLCRASSRGILEIMENCLIMGAEIDFEGCSIGSALMIACACGRLDAVKLLVRQGAAISYVGKRGLTSAVLAGSRSERVIAWLLVGQFDEQARLNSGDEVPSDSRVNMEICPWSGIGTAALRLVGRREMQPHESSLDYAVRLSALKRQMRGVVVPQGLFP